MERGRWGRLAGAALGGATICLLNSLASRVSPRHTALYDFIGPASALYLPAVLDLALVAGVLWALLVAAERWSRVRTAIWFGMLCFLPWVLLENASAGLGQRVPRWAGMASLGLCGALYLGANLACGEWAGKWAGERVERVRRFGEYLLCVAGLTGALALGEIGWLSFGGRHLNDAPGLSFDRLEGQAGRAGLGQVGHGRVIWIVLDELSYRQVYEHRPAGLGLPGFEELAREATVFTQVRPAGLYTEEVLPTLMNGVADDGVRASADGRELWMHEPGGGGWRRFNEQDTVFADAQRLGYKVGVAGWYNPYCRLLGEVAARCVWSGHTGSQVISPVDALREGMFRPLVQTMLRLRQALFEAKRLSPEELFLGELHWKDEEELSRASDAMLGDARLDFVFVHLPVPHPEGIWDRRAGQFAVGRSAYVDNLALADAYVAHVRALLEQRGEWDGATLLVMGDHTWRTGMWRGRGAWSAADEAASEGGRFDERPGYVVKLPGQHGGARLEVPFAAVRTRLLLDALLRRELAGPEELRAWVEAGR